MNPIYNKNELPSKTGPIQIISDEQEHLKLIENTYFFNPLIKQIV
jgi:hypothetical protein